MQYTIYMHTCTISLPLSTLLQSFLYTCHSTSTAQQRHTGKFLGSLVMQMEKHFCCYVVSSLNWFTRKRHEHCKYQTSCSLNTLLRIIAQGCCSAELGAWCYEDAIGVCTICRLYIGQQVGVKTKAECSVNCTAGCWAWWWEDAMDILCLYSRSVTCTAECWAAWWCECESASSDTDVDRRTRARAFRTCSHTSHIHEQQLRWHPHHHDHDHQTSCWQGNLILQPTLSVTIR